MKRHYYLLPLMLFLTSCFLDKSFETFEVKEYKALHSKGKEVNSGQVNFMLDSLGSLSLTSLVNVNIMPIKVYGTALLIAEESESATKFDAQKIPSIMKKYGFIQTQKILNWNEDQSPSPQISGSVGFVHTQINQKILGQKISIEVANITCAACHSNVTFNAEGMPKNEVWLGAGNTSLNLDGFLNQIYIGLKKAMENPALFLTQIRLAYPEMSLEEERTIKKFIFPKLISSLKKYKAMDRVLPFPNGGPGHTNGIGAFKRDAKILRHPFKFHSEEAGIVSIPNIMDRGFRSSFTIDGAYAVIGKNRFERVSLAESIDEHHLDEMASLAAFFTYSAMGNSINNIEPNIPKVKDIFKSFLSHSTSAKYPSVINSQKALIGEKIFKNNCASCHGDYSDGVENVRLLSFPNKFVLQQKMGTDPYRWKSITKNVVDFTDKNVFSKYVDAGYSLGGYTAPLLSGLWSKAPYLHNGSVPTLWQLMNPQLRPMRFQTGGHALDLVTVGIKGETREDGMYAYPLDYRPWSVPVIFDTRENGKSNKGHEWPFFKLSEDDKWNLLEYLKLL